MHNYLYEPQKTPTLCGKMVRFTLGTLLLSFTITSAEARKPNFVFLLVDDLGWADVGCYGSSFHKTPHIDALAESGVRFTDAYTASPVCSPTRASIMTGRHPVRVGITDWIPGAKQTGKFKQLHDRDHLALEEITIAEVLKQNGYKTFFAGKWHLGGQGHYPEDQGFDINVGGHEAGSPSGGYYSPWSNPRLKSTFDGEYLTERLTDETNWFIEAQSNKDQPFVAFLSYYNVHTPIQAYKKRVDEYRQKAAEFTDQTPMLEMRDGVSRGRQDNPDYASMVAAIDDSVGSITRKLNTLGIAGDTVVIFFSDNGGLCTRPPRKQGKRKRGKHTMHGPGCNLPLKSGKGWLYEGGIRVATIIRAPNIVKPGGICPSPVVSMDFFPTMLELAQIPLMPSLHMDGESLVDLLKNPQHKKNRTLAWHYPHYHGSGWSPGGALRKGDWKLIEFWEHGDSQLYHLAEDLGEQKDLSETHADTKATLTAELAAWRKEVGAAMPEAKD